MAIDDITLGAACKQFNVKIIGNIISFHFVKNLQQQLSVENASLFPKNYIIP